MLRSVDAIERSVHKTNEWLSDLAAELGIEGQGGRLADLRSILQMLRDQLTIDEGGAARCAAHAVLRGAFYEGL